MWPKISPRIDIIEIKKRNVTLTLRRSLTRLTFLNFLDQRLGASCQTF